MRRTVFDIVARLALALFLIAAVAAPVLVSAAAQAQGIGNGGGSGDGTGNGGGGVTVGGGDTLGSLITSTSGQLNVTVAQVASWICFLMALWLGYSGVVRLKANSDNPNAMPLRDPLLRLGAAGGLLSIGTVIIAIANSIYGQGMTGDAMTTGALSSSTSGTAQGIDDMMIRLIGDIRDPMITLLRVFCFIAAVFFGSMAVYRLVKHSENGPRGTLGAGTLVTLLMAGVFASMGSMMDAVTLSMFGSDGQESTLALAYNFGGTVNDKANATLKAVLVFVQILGMISFVRGFLMLRAITDGVSQSSMTAAFTHIFGGAIAANIALLVQLVQATLGLNIVT